MRHNNISSQHINLFCVVIEGVSQERHGTTLWNFHIATNKIVNICITIRR